MRFQIHLTSNGPDEDPQPAKGAIKTSHPHYSGHSYWAIELASIEELLALCVEVGQEVIVSFVDSGDERVPSWDLEIYNDYRE